MSKILSDEEIAKLQAKKLVYELLLFHDEERVVRMKVEMYPPPLTSTISIVVNPMVDSGFNGKNESLPPQYTLGENLLQQCFWIDPDTNQFRKP